ncbi:hypothetical protein H8959_010962 [Pygathrix nigripes]
MDYSILRVVRLRVAQVEDVGARGKLGSARADAAENQRKKSAFPTSCLTPARGQDLDCDSLQAQWWIKVDSINLSSCGICHFWGHILWVTQLSSAILMD